MWSLLSTAALIAVSSTLAKGDQDGHLSKFPYRPFAQNRHWRAKSPAPQPQSKSDPVIPKVKNAKIIGLAADPTLDRDSCGSVPFNDRVLWTCRDTQPFLSNGSVLIDALISSTASWTNYNKDGLPELRHLPSGADPLKSVVLTQYGANSADVAFFPVTEAFCGDPGGGCADGTRFAIWPDVPPMVTASSQWGVTAYTWIRESHITKDLGVVESNPASALYRVNYNPRSPTSPNELPLVTIVDQQFWKQGEISFGNYGNVVKDGIAYLFGQAEGITSLAKVSLESVEDKSAYQYWVDGVWTSQMPTLGQDGINITNANAVGQGTYYYSEPWKSFVWIGGGPFIGSDMYITTSPDPTGPWIEPFKFFSGVNGDYALGAYSIQAHPGLISDPSKNRIYITYTKNDVDQDGNNVYTSPLVRVVWE